MIISKRVCRGDPARVWRPIGGTVLNKESHNATTDEDVNDEARGA